MWIKCRGKQIVEEFQNTWRCCSVRPLTLIYIKFPRRGFEFTVINVHFTNLTFHLGSRAGWVSWLPSALYQLNICIQRPQPMCFSNWPILVRPSMEFRLAQNSYCQMCQGIFVPHKSLCWYCITGQIVANYDFSSWGKFARISSCNWSMLKIKAVRRFSIMLLVLFMFFFPQTREWNANCIWVLFFFFYFRKHAGCVKRNAHVL